MSVQRQCRSGWDGPTRLLFFITGTRLRKHVKRQDVRWKNWPVDRGRKCVIDSIAGLPSNNIRHYSHATKQSTEQTGCTVNKVGRPQNAQHWRPLISCYSLHSARNQNLGIEVKPLGLFRSASWFLAALLVRHSLRRCFLD